MKKGILLMAVILLSTASLAQAQDGQLTGKIDATYVSSYIWRGFDYYADDHPAFSASVTLLDLFDTGLGITVLNRRALTGQFVNSENLDVTVFYSNSLCQGESYATDYTAGWVYYGFPDEPKKGSRTSASAQAADMQELFAAFSWPSVLGGGLVPSYTVLTMWPSKSDSAANKNAGWAHIIGLGYDLAVPGILPDTAEQILHLSAAAVYNDGVAPGVVITPLSGTVDHDWSHAVFGVSTDFDLGNDLTLTPAAYYQSSWEESVNTEDEAWVSLNLSYAF